MIDWLKNLLGGVEQSNNNSVHDWTSGISYQSLNPGQYIIPYGADPNPNQFYQQYVKSIEEMQQKKNELFAKYPKHVIELYNELNSNTYEVSRYFSNPANLENLDRELKIIDKHMMKNNFKNKLSDLVNESE